MLPPCPICGDVKRVSLYDASLHVYRCRQCTHTFTVVSKQDQETYAPDYFSAAHKNWFLHPNIRLFGLIARFLKRHFSDNAVPVLDIGCGNGDFLKFIGRAYPAAQLSGIDVASVETFPFRFFHGDFHTFAFAEKFSAIIVLMVVEHVEDPRAFVQKIHTLLSTDGVVILDTIDSGSFLYRLAGWLRRVGIRGPFDQLFHHHHLQHYTNKSLSRLLEQEGFEVITHRNHNFPLAALDLPKKTGFEKTVFTFGVAIIFALTNILRGGMNQVIICRKVS